MDLKELYEQCVFDVNGDKIRGARRFLIAAKKANPEVTLEECMAASGYSSEDEKKAVNLAQTFRTKVFNPTRDHLAKVKFNIIDTDPIFGRSKAKEGAMIERTPENAQLRKEILSLLPSNKRTRTVRAAKADDMRYIDDLIQ